MSNRDYPICKKCGHGASSHTTKMCKNNHGVRSITYGDTPACDCNGWERDMDWPPKSLEVRQEVV